MTSEEKQAIFKLREIIEYDKQHRLETIYDKEQIEFRNNIELVLDLVEKLQKENEELKYENLNLKEEKMIDNSSCKPLNNFYDYYDCIPKDKIREKIKELEQQKDLFFEKL